MDDATHFLAEMPPAIVAFTYEIPQQVRHRLLEMIQLQG